MSILKVKNLTYQTNGKVILNNISLDIQKSGLYCIIGENGAGKSSLAYILMGTHGYSNYKGEIIFRNENIKKLNTYKRAKKGIALAWQEPARFEGITVQKYLEISCSDKNLASKSLLQVGLNPKLYMSRILDNSLSGGERKRIELASIIAAKPKLAILDEPDSGIDIESFDNIKNSISNLKKSNIAVIVITHSLELLKNSDYAFLICGGKIILKGNPKNIIEFYKNKCIVCKHKNIPYENK